jgi:hypothetical protein
MEQPHRVMLISGLIAGLIGLAAGFLGGRLAAPPAAPPAAVAAAPRFQLLDQAGRERGVWDLDPQGAARLAFWGESPGVPLVSLTATPQGGATLELGDAKQSRALVLQTKPDGSREVGLYYAANLRLGLTVQKNGDPAVMILDQNHPRLALGLSSQGAPQVVLYGDNRKAALEVIARPNGDRSLNLFGQDGTPRLVLGLKNDQKAALGLFDRQGKTRAALLDEPSLILLKDGKAVRSLP